MTYMIMICAVCYGVTGYLSTLLLCQPFAYNWNDMRHGHCGNIRQAGEAGAIANLLIDFITILLPMPQLWRLQLPVAKRLALTGIFGVGLVYVFGLSLTTSHSY